MTTLDKALTHFKKTFHSEPHLIIRSSGRVNLLGEHVDYNDGWVLPVAIDCATYLVASHPPKGSKPSGGSLASIAAADLDEGVTFRVTETASKKNIVDCDLPSWALYPAGVAHILREANLKVTGINCAFASNVPRGAGLSSSASVELAFAVAWQKLGGWSKSGMALAQLCQRAENQYVGINCGIMDQFACANGKEDHALLLDCRTLDWSPVLLPKDVAIVIADTTKRRELGKSEYNNRRAACEEAVRILKTQLPHIKALRDVSVEDFNKHSHLLSLEVAKRARHVIEECERTMEAAQALERNDIQSFGHAMNESHRTLRDLYEVSCAELDAMVSAAQSLEGCYGARLTGAGFGGCVVALVNANATKDFEHKLAKRYEKATGLKPEIYIGKASRGTEVVNNE